MGLSKAWIRRATALLLASLVGVAAHAQQAETQAAPAAAVALDRVRVSTFIDGAVRALMTDRHVAGVTVAVIDRQGVVLTRGYGQAGEGRAVDADTLFRVGSISKTPTWLAIQQLADEGKLTLDDPVNDHLPEALRIPDQGYDEPIRIRHLMTHTPGFENSALGHLFVSGPEQVLPLERYLARYRPARVRPAGSLAVYSNYGADLAGAIVAHESGMDFPTYAETRIFAPLGMASTSYREPYSAAIARANGLPTPLAPAFAARVTDGYRYVLGQFQAQPFEYVTQMGAAGSMSSSANDMALYMAALLDPQRMAAARVLRGDSATTLTEPMHANFEGWGEWRHGFMSFDLGGGRWAYGHGGDTIYQHSLMLISPDLGFGIFMSTNTDAGPRLLGPALTSFVREFYPIAEGARADVSQAELAQYAGTYRSFRRPYHRTERALFSLIGAVPIAAADNGDLIIAAGGEVERLIPLGDGIYRSSEGASRIAFREVEGRMRAFDPAGLGPMERVGFFETANWLALICALGAIVALWGVIAGARRLISRTETRAALIFDGLCLIWLVAFALMAVAILPWTDQAAVIFGYPGPVFPIASWFALFAVVATILAAVLAFVWRSKDWSWLRWTRAGAAMAVFAVLSVSLWQWGFLGYSGF